MLERFFKTWSRLVLAHPWGVAVLTLIALSVCCLSISRLRFETDINSMIPTRSGAALERIARAFSLREKSFLVVESPRSSDGAALVAFARAFEDALKGNGEIAGFRHGFEDMQSALLTDLLPYAPRYASAGDESIERLLSEEDIRDRIERQSARLSFPGLNGLQDLVERDPLDMGAFLLSRFGALKGTYRFDPASPNFISPDGRAILIQVQGRRPVNDIASARATAMSIERSSRRAGLKQDRRSEEERNDQRAVLHGSIPWSAHRPLTFTRAKKSATLRNSPASESRLRGQPRRVRPPQLLEARRLDPTRTPALRAQPGESPKRGMRPVHRGTAARSQQRGGEDPRFRAMLRWARYSIL